MSESSGGKCWYCGETLTLFDYGRGDTCRKCGRDTKVCKGCFFYDPALENACKEPQAERVVDKERSNFCDYFKPSLNPSSASNSASKDALKAAAEALFKK